jgi:hypothetical protein
MMRKNIALLATLAATIALVVLVERLCPGGDSSASTPVPDPPARPSEAREFRGISLQIHTGDARHPYETLIDEIAKTGANTICLIVHGFQEHARSQIISVDPAKTPSDERLAELIAHAHKRGLRVALMPVILLSDRRGSEWRGQIEPPNWPDWWKQYRTLLLRYARLAEKSEVELFSVGSELIKTETQDKPWRETIAAVRAVYTGRLFYSANWDHYQVPQWWDALDIVGMTTYYTLAEGDRPTRQELLDRWAEIRNKILAWQKKVNRPILFTEVGWPNQISAAEFPWNYYAQPDKPDPELQAMCFETFFATFGREPAATGFFVWEWRDRLDADVAPDSDTSYVPTGKPAMKVIRRFFQSPGPLRPQSQPSSAPATAPADQSITENR